METESQGGESDLPKVTVGMKSETEMKIAKAAPCPELGKLLPLSPLGCWGGGVCAWSIEVGAGELAGALMHMQDRELRSTKHV